MGTEERLVGPESGFVDRCIAFCLQNELVVFLVIAAILVAGVLVAPFDWQLGKLLRDPVPVDAIPDIGENQQIVFTEWKGRSPQDIEDQISYPLTAALLGVPGVKSVRSFSMFGFSSIYLIFEEDVEFYWSRSRILEKLSSLPAGTIPEGVRPTLGPDATPLGQVFWYTLEGRDSEGRATGGWDLQELRSIQDWQLRYELMAVPGVAEVASVGGFVQEYQVEVDPDAMRAHGVTLQQVARALQRSNIDVGARSIEINRVEYVVRGLGFVKELSDLAKAVVVVRDNVPIRVGDVGRVVAGPALRRGALDKGGAEAVGGVVVVRYGANPLAVIRAVKEKIARFAPGLPSRDVSVASEGGRDQLRRSRVTVVPFYDRTGLIHETLGTLESALTEEILITIIVVVVMLMNLRSSLLISGLVPMAVLMVFIAMKLFHVDANVVALSGIAIAIGTMVDMGIVLNENILRHLEEADDDEPSIRVVFRAASEVGGAVMTAVATTVLSFLPVFTMEGAEGRLFKPLAYTKTFALLASLVVALTLIPPLAHLVFGRRSLRRHGDGTRAFWSFVAAIACQLVLACFPLTGLLLAVGFYLLLRDRLPPWSLALLRWGANLFAVVFVLFVVTKHWMPLGVELGLTKNIVFVSAMVGGLLGAFYLFQFFYASMLAWCLDHKLLFLTLPLGLCLFGASIWLGFHRVFAWIPVVVEGLGGRAEAFETWEPWVWAGQALPGLGKEFMPDLDEGSFLFMPTTMPHASMGEALDVVALQDRAINALPEIDMAVGKIGRVESPLDPAPISMIETLINYKGEYLSDPSGRRRRFRHRADEDDLFRDEFGAPVKAPDGQAYEVRGRFLREKGRLIPDPSGRPFRLWRPPLDPALNPGRKAWKGILAPDDIWEEILRVTELPGTTSAPRLQPIAARIVMLQSGMRAPMGLKIYGKGKVDLEQLEAVGLDMERLLRQLPAIKASAVTAERIVGKPYLEIEIDRSAISRHGLDVADVQDVIHTAVGGRAVTTTVEGRERYAVLLRYKRELRGDLGGLERVAVATASGAQVPLKELMVGRRIRYRRGPQVIKSEDGALVTYVLFDKLPGWAEVDVVEAAQHFLEEKIRSGELSIPPGVSYRFAGSYENQLRSEKRLTLVLPLALFLIFLTLYFHFARISTTLLVFSGIAVAWSGGFILIWLYGCPWFLNVAPFGVNLRTLFQIQGINLSVAVWVGFLALFGIATDDGVVMASYLDQSFEGRAIETVEEIRAATLSAAHRRIRPCLMTTATTLLALLPVLTSTGRGSDIMVPMAIPSFGGMSIEVVTMFVVPVLYCALREWELPVAGGGWLVRWGAAAKRGWAALRGLVASSRPS